MQHAPADGQIVPGITPPSKTALPTYSVSPLSDTPPTTAVSGKAPSLLFFHLPGFLKCSGKCCQREKWDKCLTQLQAIMLLHSTTDEAAMIIYDINVKTVVFRCPQVASISNPGLLSSSETGVNPGIRSEKSTYFWMRSISEIYWWYLFHKEVKSRDSTTWFRIWQL